MSEKIEILEQVGDSELIVGEVYANESKEVLLKFKGYDKHGDPLFDYYAGQHLFNKLPDGSIPFFKHWSRDFYKTKITKS